MPSPNQQYRGRLAPSPTGYLHLGHAATFWTAFQRARDSNGTLIFRNEDLDQARCQPEFIHAMFEDLRWLGIEWQEGPDIGGPHAPYNQSERHHIYRLGFQQLADRGVIYPCDCSRKKIAETSLRAPHAGEEEPVYPGTCRANPADRERSGVSWRFRVPDGETISFIDQKQGPQSFVAGRDFGDFLVWRKDDFPAYQLAVILDDAAMEITEVVRGEDLLLSTARQILLYRALDLPVPEFYHCPLIRDRNGERLAKRHDSLNIRTLRARGLHPSDILAQIPNNQ